MFTRETTNGPPTIIISMSLVFAASLLITSWLSPRYSLYFFLLANYLFLLLYVGIAFWLFLTALVAGTECSCYSQWSDRVLRKGHQPAALRQHEEIHRPVPRAGRTDAQVAQ